MLIHVPRRRAAHLSVDLIKEECEILHEDMHRPLGEVPADYKSLPALGFVRNPWDWYVSWYTHMREKGPRAGDEWEYEAFEGSRLLPTIVSWNSRLSRGITSSTTTRPWCRQFLQGCQVGRFEHLREWFIRFLRQHRIELPDLERKILEYPLNNVGTREPYQVHYRHLPHLIQLVWQGWVAQTYGYVYETAGGRACFRALPATREPSSTG